MFTLLFIIMVPPSETELSLVYAEAPIERFETLNECLAWRDVLSIEANAYGWDVTVAQCERDPTT